MNFAINHFKKGGLSMELKGSQTEKNLLTAFAGESQARNRYTYFASQARKEGYQQIAAIFEETANQEKEHAKRFFKFLEGGEVEITGAFPAGVIGTTLGVLAGYFGGRVDMVINFIITTRLSMPVVLVALAVVSLIGSSLTVVIWVLGLLIWDRFAVVMRSATQQVRALDFVTAAQALGCSTWRILTSEIMPNIANHLIVVATLEMAHAILLEAALSFLGLGVQPPEPSWGLMISEAKGLMFFDGWLIAIPGTALFMLVLAINLLGDGMRDVTAPENRN